MLTLHTQLMHRMQIIKRAMLAFAVMVAVVSPWAMARGLATTAPAVLYDSHSDEARKLFVLTAGHPLRQIAAVDGWYKVMTYNDKSGWIKANQVRPWSGAVVLEDKVPVYTEDNIVRSSKAFYAQKHVLLEVLGVKGVLVEVQHKDGEKGYVVFDRVWLNNPQ